jgi:hypothetical protein
MRRGRGITAGLSRRATSLGGLSEGHPDRIAKHSRFAGRLLRILREAPTSRLARRELVRLHLLSTRPAPCHSFVYVERPWDTPAEVVESCTHLRPQLSGRNIPDSSQRRELACEILGGASNRRSRLWWCEPQVRHRPRKQGLGESEDEGNAVFASTELPCRITDNPITCEFRSKGFEKSNTLRRQSSTSRERQYFKVAQAARGGLRSHPDQNSSGSGDCYAAGRHTCERYLNPAAPKTPMSTTPKRRPRAAPESVDSALSRTPAKPIRRRVKSHPRKNHFEFGAMELIARAASTPRTTRTQSRTSITYEEMASPDRSAQTTIKIMRIE